MATAGFCALLLAVNTRRRILTYSQTKWAGGKADCSMESLLIHLRGNVADAVEIKKRRICVAATEQYLLINDPVITDR